MAGWDTHFNGYPGCLCYLSICSLQRAESVLLLGEEEDPDQKPINGRCGMAIVSIAFPPAESQIDGKK
jgi:hypothetical protein